jgi:hypothetical protein
MSVLRPGDLRGHQGVEPEQRMGRKESSAPALTKEWIDAYDRMSASQAKFICETDSNFNALADELYQKRNPKGEGRP